MSTMSNALRPSTRRIQLPPSSIISHNLQQTRHATLIKRPKRPYTFTQLVTLTDGSSYLHRTTSPLPVYRPTKDQRSAPMWNPSDERLMNLEDDDAGKLKLFRSRFGRGYDLGNANAEEEAEAGAEAKAKGTSESKPDDSGDGIDLLMDLITIKNKSTASRDAQNTTKKGTQNSASKKK